MNARLPVFSLLFLALPLALGSPAHGQQGELVISVRDAESSRPLTGAEVRVQGVGLGGVTNETGSLRVRGVATGPRAVEVRRLGYSPASSTARVAAGESTGVRFDLAPAPIALEPVKVRARRRILLTRGFYRRKEAGVGTFLTRPEIDEISPRSLGDLLSRLPGVSVTRTRVGATARSRGAGPTCPIQYYLDGVMIRAFTADFLAPTDIEGLELYRGAASIPAEYNRGTALCGVVLIWTRGW